VEHTSAASEDLGRIPETAEEPIPPFEVLLRACTTSAVHLEMRDSYTPSDPWFGAWLAGDRKQFEQRLSRPWLGLIREMTDRGVQVRRARVISEPVTSYVRFEHATTSSNVGAGEQVSWLPRRSASGLLLPGNDFWAFDTRLVLFWYFSGDGEFEGAELSDDPALVKQCTASFDAVWQQAIPHHEYRLR
jgi:hypothetical protein